MRPRTTRSGQACQPGSARCYQAYGRDLLGFRPLMFTRME
jgi:hypothetical protein